MNPIELQELLNKKENLRLDFKREYKLYDTPPANTDKRKWADYVRGQWDELIKDVIALANGNVGTAGQDGLLIIGVDDELPPSGIRHIHDTSQLKITEQQILAKVNSVCDPPLPNLTCERIEIAGKQVIVITIHSSPHFHETSRQLKTTKGSFDSLGALRHFEIDKTYSSRTAFVRRGENVFPATDNERGVIRTEKIAHLQQRIDRKGLESDKVIWRNTQMENFNDFIEQVIPTAPSDEIPQDAFVRQIGQRFNSEHQRQRIVGSLRSGKTNLMAQFVRQHKNQCIAYFVTNDPSTQSVRTFLYTLCFQANLLLGTNAPPDTITVTELEALLDTVSIKLAREALKRKTIYYFVIDGIENSLDGVAGERIIDKLRLLKLANYSPYMLFSCSSDQIHKLPDYLNCQGDITPPEFSRLEVETYLEGVGFSQQEIIEIRNKYRPLPGYLKILKESKRTNQNFDLESAPLKLDQLIDEQVQLVMQDSNELTASVLKILAASPASLPIEILIEMTGVSENSMREHIQKINIAKLDEQKRRLEFTDDMVHDAVRKWFSEHIKDTTKELLTHVQHNYPNENLLLTLLFEQLQDYEGIQNTLACQQILGMLDVNRDMINVIKRLRSASRMALDKGYTEDLVKWTLGITVAHSFIEHAADSQEIEALLAIGDSQEALGKAYLIPEASSKVRLLARAYTVMKDRGDRLQREALSELGSMVNSLDLQALNQESVFEIAIDLFPILKEAAFSLLEKVIGQRQKRSIIEVAIEAIETASEKATQEDAAIILSVYMR